MSYAELEPYLVGARLSFNVALPANSLTTQQNLLVVDTPPFMSRPWTLNLLGFRYSTGIILAPPGTTQAPSLATATNDNQTTAAGAVKLRIAWGVEGAVEVAVLDYPTHGGSLQLSAGMIRVDVVVDGFVGSTGITPPLVGGFLSPSPRAGVNPIANPKFTYPTRTTTGLSSTSYLIPKRAVAFRVYQIDTATTADVSVSQVDLTGTVVEYDGLAANLALGIRTVGVSTGDYVAVNDQAQYVLLTNTSATARSYSMIFLLDLG